MIELRAAGESDVAAIAALVESAYRGDASRGGWTTEADLLDGQRTDVDSIRRALARGARILLADDADGSLIGCCQLEPAAEGLVHFGMFAIRPDRQAGGLGRAMLATAEAEARTAFAAARLEMTVIAQRAELIDWYERRGYRRTGETRPFPYGDLRYGQPRRDDLHFVVLEKELAAQPAG